MKKLLSVLAGGGGLSEILLALSSLVGVTISPAVAVWMATGLSVGGWWLYHNGFDGLWRLLRQGKPAPPV